MDKERRLMYAIGLSLTFMTVEVIGGWMANSIAIYSDAAHLLTDIAGFGIALVAVTAAKAPGTRTLTYGLVRAEIFGALLSVLTLWIISVWLLYEAFNRAQAWFEGHPEEINGQLMFGVALFGVLVNLCLGIVFHEEHGAGHGHDHSHGHAHSHSSSKGGYQQVDSCNGHDHDGGHAHGHSHNENKPATAKATATNNKSATPAKAPSERSALFSSQSIASHLKAQYTILDDDDRDLEHAHDTGHDHGHDHAHGEHSTSCAHDHSHDHGHGHGSGHEAAVAPTSNAAKVIDANLEAAQLHVLADLAQSIGVAIAGFIIFYKPDWQIVDPLCTLLASLFGLYSTLPLIQRGVHILLEGVPSHVDWQAVQARLEAIPGVDDVHDLHIWSLSSDTTSLSVHMRATNPAQALRQAHAICKSLEISHATIQVHDAKEDPEAYCHAASCQEDRDANLPLHANCASAKKKQPEKKSAQSQSAKNGHGHGHDHGHGHNHH